MAPDMGPCHWWGRPASHVAEVLTNPPDFSIWVITYREGIVEEATSIIDGTMLLNNSTFSKVFLWFPSNICLVLLDRAFELFPACVCRSSKEKSYAVPSLHSFYNTHLTAVLLVEVSAPTLIHLDELSTLKQPLTRGWGNLIFTKPVQVIKKQRALVCITKIPTIIYS